MSNKNRLSILFTVMAFVAAFSVKAFAQEDRPLLEFDLANFKNEALFHLFPPPLDTNDSYNVSSRGLKIIQTEDEDEVTPWNAGFTSATSMAGDFRIELDLDFKIAEPLSGWGQGVILLARLNDGASTELKVHRIASPGRGQIAQAEIARSGFMAESIYRPKPNDMTSGKLVLERTGAKARFLLVEKNEEFLIETLDCPTADVKYISIICTRLDKGNTAASFLLKRLKLEAESFPFLKRTDKPWFSWWHALVAFQFLGLGALVFFAFKKGRQSEAT